MPTRLARRLNTTDAVIIGLGAMIGAGIFGAIGPATAAAGSGLLIAALLAGFLAFMNATTMAQLAAVYPESGGTYTYGRRLLGPAWGFLAGWGFVIGKIASCTAMALTFANYVYPQLAHPIAVGIVLLLTFVNYFGVTKTALATRIIVCLVLVTLGLIVSVTLIGSEPNPDQLSGFLAYGGITGILQATGIMFFAFAGYARVATLGEEVVEPKTTIPKAIVISLGITLFIYFMVILTVLLSVPIKDLAESKAPLALAVASSRFHSLAPIARMGAAIASVGVLLSLLAGVSRTVFAMAQNQDLPKSLNAVHPVYKVPHHAELSVGLVIAIVVSFADLRTSIGFSSFAVLIYYAIANTAALKLEPQQRLYPKWMAVLGLIACIVIALHLPKASIGGGVILFALGLLYFFGTRRVTGRKT